ncbi:type I polyketide synthase [Herbaspirillum rubrisubalbicans M1]|uniref:type I polyketide synthase n=1 Tax=Herbaspirillum rubrisubalbicans TaxID=80842 RepID=UPI00073AA8BD|nr:type I polyketide synthase [Herbaspirillum rubrisubalbicans]ALU91286.1 type I polyketide synthase [Herbaspirillum rubrisubalbicans M1]
MIPAENDTQHIPRDAAPTQPTGKDQERQAIAIIGLAFRFPGDLADEDSLWSALSEGRDMVTHLPAERFATDELAHPERPEAGRSVNFSAGVLSGIDQFDAAFFGISPREAAWLDPQQRLLLELSWEAMENAGKPPSSLAGTDCAVYVGISSLDYGTRGLDDLASLSAHTMTGNTLSLAANRLSYFFDLRGPSLAVDTACSSSLFALHHACRCLQHGEAKVALVGGVNLLLHPYPFVGFTKASMLSADGRCKVFDAAGNGYVRAEGGAVLLLKPLRQAQRDGDCIHAVILASGINSDGKRKTGITIPSQAGQAELMRSVLKQSGLRGADIDFIEAHGTGTMVGDPVEAAAIGEVYGGQRAAPLPIGSIKANLGHLEAASGMASLVKTVLALKRRALPPQIQLHEPHPSIDLEALNLRCHTSPFPLSKEGPLLAGVNSFGFGGANAHVLLREYHADVSTDCRTTPASHPPLFLSAANEAALRALAGRYQRLLDKHTAGLDFYDLAWSAAYRRNRLPSRLALYCEDGKNAATALAAFAQGQPHEAIVQEQGLPQKGRVAFVYTGNGAQWTGMALRLMHESSRFAVSMADLDARMAAVAGFSILEQLQADAHSSRLDDTEVAQPLIFAIQVALTQWLAAQHVIPDVVCGHSVGEVAAAWACGMLDMDAAIRLIVARSRAQGMTRGSGRMAAVGLSVTALEQLLGEMVEPLDLEIAAINSADNLTVSGRLADLERLQARLNERNQFFRLLDLDYAFHSRYMEPAREALLTQLGDWTSGTATRAMFISTVSGTRSLGPELDAHYWWRNVREPVRLSDAVSEMARQGCHILVEIGPHAILQRYLRDCLQSNDIKGRILPTLRRHADGITALTDTVLRIQLLAEQPDLSAHFPMPGRPVNLPNYPWQRESFWHPSTNESGRAITSRRTHPLLGWSLPRSSHCWENVVDPCTLPWLADHRVGGAIVFPGAAYLEMALAAASQWSPGQCLSCEQIDILAPMVFDGNHARTLRFELDEHDGSFQIKSRPRLSEEDWILHCAGRILRSALHPKPVCSDLPRQASLQIDAQKHYRHSQALGLDYGPSFHSLQEVHLHASRLEGQLLVPEELDITAYLIHPVLLDGCYQALLNLVTSDASDKMQMAFLPIKTGGLHYRRAGKPHHFRIEVRRHTLRSLVADIDLFDPQGHLLASLYGCRFRAAPVQSKVAPAPDCWQMVARLLPHPLDERVSQLPDSQEMLAQLSRSLKPHVSQQTHWQEESLPLLKAAIVAWSHHALLRISRQGESHLQNLLASADAYVQWVAGILQSENLLSQVKGEWQLSPDSNLPPAEDIWNLLLREPDMPTSLLLAVGRIGPRLAELLLAPALRTELLEEFGLSPMGANGDQLDPVGRLMHSALTTLLQSMAGGLSRSRRLRVLEIGARANLPSPNWLRQFPEHQVVLTYAYPDAGAENPGGTSAASLGCKVIDFDCQEWTFKGAIDGLPGSFDIIVVHHVLHQARQRETALQQLRKLLIPGGRLLVAERHADWAADLTNGLQPRWWRNTRDGGPSLSSLLAPAHWMSALTWAGFKDIHQISSPDPSACREGSYLLLAQRPDSESTSCAAVAAASWLLLVDPTSHDFAQSLAKRLERQGQQLTLHNITLAAGAEAYRAADHVLFLCGWSTPPEDTAALCSTALQVVQALGTAAVGGTRLWFITRDGALVSDQRAPASAGNPAQCALWGLGRVVMNEYPKLASKLIDLAGWQNEPSELQLQRLENELLHPDRLEEIILTDNARQIPLWQAHTPPAAIPASPNRVRLDFNLPGQLRNLAWRPNPTTDMGPEEVEVAVQATGLNFRDIMYLMGLLPDEAVEAGFGGASLGLEFSGVVSRVGRSVTAFEPGDKVIGFGSACFASHVVTRCEALALMPGQWSFEAAATVPTVFFTTYYALKELANLQPGERVLIHGAAGGIGLAAIQLAKLLGAEIFATAGSEEKRDFVRLLGVDHVFDSRNLDYVERIMEHTSGQGVDVILNSLAGEAIRRNLSVLKPFGRFLELGKRDFFENTRIGLRPFKDNISYFGIDADQLLTRRPDLAARLLKEVMALFQDGHLFPLPYRAFPAERVEEAFRFMQQAKHIGKVVVSLAAAPTLQLEHTEPAGTTLTSSGTWLITGGLSGFGLETARWLARNGVRSLVLVGRRGWATPAAKEAVDTLSALGADVHVRACDISDKAAVTAMIEQLHDLAAPIRGVVHAAAVFDDGLLVDLDAARMAAVIQPKLLGAWNLHQATLKLALDHFLLYSSLSCAIGNPGQGNYVAANAALEGLAAMRRHLGLPVTCIAWGPIADTGYLARNPSVHRTLEQRLGSILLDSQHALRQLERLSVCTPSLIVADLDWPRLSTQLPGATAERFALFKQSSHAPARPDRADELQHILRTRSTEDIHRLIEDRVTQELSRILAIAPERIGLDTALHELGLDSLMAVELALSIEQGLQLRLPAMLLNDAPTARKIIRRLVAQLQAPRSPAETDEAATGVMERVIDELSNQHGEILSQQELQDIAQEARAMSPTNFRTTR